MIDIQQNLSAKEIRGCRAAIEAENSVMREGIKQHEKTIKRLLRLLENEKEAIKSKANLIAVNDAKYIALGDELRTLTI